MHHRLFLLMVIDELRKDVVLTILALGIVAVGIFFILAPTQHLLQSDRKTAHWIYQQEVKASGDRNRAVSAAATFYRIFGSLIVLFGFVVVLCVWIS